MADQHGGYRRPEHPAPASGPGRLAKRTDGGPGQKLRVPTGLPYGDAQALHAQESTAAMSDTPMAKAADIPSAQPAAAAGAPPQLPPFGGATARPGEPVTHGVDIGAGGGPEALAPFPGMPSPAAGTGWMTSLLQRLSATDTTGLFGRLLTAAESRNA